MNEEESINVSTEEGRPFGKEMAARLNYNIRNNVDVEGDRQFRSEERSKWTAQQEQDEKERAFLSRLKQAVELDLAEREKEVKDKQDKLS